LRCTLLPLIVLMLAAPARFSVAADSTAIADPSTAPASRARLDPNLPTLFLIGDSTVKNGHDNGDFNMWGWGNPIAKYFDESRINVQNRALGGRSSRSYYTEGLWDKVMADVKPGDFVLMQFGTNDGGAIDKPIAPGRPSRASIHGSGDETKDVTDEKTGKTETVHTFGWYMCNYATDTKARGATPIMLSLIPRNDWKDGKVQRATASYAAWTADAAKQAGCAFIDLNAIIADEYDKQGQEKVKGYFPNEHTHTNLDGADINARSVVAGIKAMKDCELNKYLSSAAAEIEPAPEREVSSGSR
jgi:lysophospholipase L1-like esterase